jgi:hypothetical protein
MVRRPTVVESTQQRSDPDPINPPPDPTGGLWSKILDKAADYIAVTVVTLIFAAVAAVASTTWAIVKPTTVTPFPSHAVVAFNGDCPADSTWKKYLPATSRVIVGSGTQTDLDARPAAYATIKLTPWPLGAPAGAEATTIIRNQLPQITLKSQEIRSVDFVPAQANPRYYAFATTSDPNPATFTDQVVLNGEPQVPINTMPPFVALTYCEKG